MRESRKTRLDFVSGSDRGLVRANNEDACLVVRLKKSDCWILVLADGMGGHRKGDVASRIAVNSVSERLYRELNPGDSAETICEKMVEAAERANVRVYLESVSDESMRGMGTTLLMAVLTPTFICIGNIGDCRAYLLREHAKFYRVTKDHTYVQHLLDLGDINEEEALVHPARHMLLRALGLPDYVNTDVYTQEIQNGDRWIFCSDGLHGYVPELEIARSVQEASNAEAAVRDLIEKANQAGGRDNVTVIAAFAEEESDPPTESDT